MIKLSTEWIELNLEVILKAKQVRVCASDFIYTYINTRFKDQVHHRSFRSRNFRLELAPFIAGQKVAEQMHWYDSYLTAVR